MEKEIKIPIPKTKKVIYATQRGSTRQPFVVFVHGLTCDMHHHLFFNGARYFEKQGFSTLRINLYDWREDARKLHECDFTTYARDIEAVVASLRAKGVKRVYGVGHSYGGAALLFTKPNALDSISLWDATNYEELPKNYEKKYLRKLGASHVMKGGFDFVMNPKLLKQIEDTQWNQLSAPHTEPVQVIVAGKGILQKGGREYYENAGADRKEFIELKGAGHGFDEDGAEEKLFAATAKWFERYT